MKVKDHAWTIVAILFSTALLWGCGEPGSALLGPDGPGIQAAKGGKKGPAAEVDVTATGAVTTPAPQRFGIAKENGHVLSLGTRFDASIDFTASQTAALADFDDPDSPGLDGPCFVDDNSISGTRIRNALTKLVDALGDERAGGFQIGKSGLDAPGAATTSADHTIFVNWAEPEGGFSLGVGKVAKLADPSTVTLISGDIDGGSEIRYTGGSVKIKDRTRPSFTVFCPNLDVIDVTIARLP